MTTGHLPPGAFRAVLAGVTDFKRHMERTGLLNDEFRVLIPQHVGEQIETELHRINPNDWMPFCEGIHVFADGHMKQLILYDSIWVGWKTGKKVKAKGKPWQITKAA